MAGAEAARLLHELRTRQIELELQNEGLRRSQVMLDAERARYFDLYDLAPVGYCTLSASGLILQANLTFARLMGVAREALTMRPISRFMVKEDQNVFHLLRTNQTATDEAQSCELRMVKGDTTQFWAHLASTALRDENDALIQRVVLSDITANRQAYQARDQAQRESDALMQAIFAHSIVSIANPAGVITFVNDTFIRISGYSREELIGQNHRIVKSDAQDDDFWHRVWETISSGQVWRGVLCNRAKNGSLYWVDTQISPFFDEAGAIEKYVSIRTDITAFKLAQQELVLAAALKTATESLLLGKFYLRATLDNLPFNFWLKDAQGRYLAVNNAFAQACGRLSPDDIVGLTDLDLWADERAQTYRRIDVLAMKSQQEQRREEREDAQGDPRWIETFVKPLFSESGLVSGTVGFSHDISARRVLQDQLHEHTAQLDAIFELSPDGFVSFDAAGRVKYVSPAFARMSGIRLAQLSGLDEKQFAALLAERCTSEGPFRGFDSLRSKTSSGPTEARERIELSGGQHRILEVELRSGNSSTVSQVLCFRDVTYHTEVERMKSEFLSTAAHELRTPMTSIHGFAEVLLHEELDEASRQEFLGIMYRQSELMASILNELLDLARIEARRGKDFVIEAAQVQALINRVLAGFKLPPGRLAPKLTLPEAPVHIMVDQTKAHQALLNVLANAYKYSPAGGEVQISMLDATQSGTATPCVGIRITDHGIGLTPAQLTHVCERFYRADTSGKVLGTGLGMSIVREIVELHGGKVDLASEFGVSTSVTLWLPAVMAE